MITVTPHHYIVTCTCGARRDDINDSELRRFQEAHANCPNGKEN